ncbi:MAG: tetratricopeptide repeat protein [Woeseia sp.]
MPANANEADEAWAEGQLAIAQQDYLRAQAYFETARNAGLRGPAVYYNIGVCQYKSGNYVAAGKTFQLIDDGYPQMRSLAQYNLGLVALKLARQEEAARHFRSSYYLSADNPKLRAMSSTQLRRLIGDARPSSPWLRTFSVRGGYDDNVTLQDEAALDPGASADSPFVEVFGTIGGPYTRRGGFRLDAGFFLLAYSDADEFNQAALHFGGLYDWRGSNWGAEVGAHAGTTMLGGDQFDRSARLSARLSRKLSATSSLEARYRYDDITAADSVFQSIEGSRQRVELRYRWYDDGRSFHLGVTNETNDRADPRVSPDRTRVQADYRYSPAVGWGFGVGAELRASDYSRLDPTRDEDLGRLHLTLTRNTLAGWQYFAQYSRADNDSSDPAFSYVRNQLSLGAFRFF